MQLSSKKQMHYKPAYWGSEVWCFSNSRDEQNVAYCCPLSCSMPSKFGRINCCCFQDITTQGTLHQESCAVTKDVTQTSLLGWVKQEASQNLFSDDCPYMLEFASSVFITSLCTHLHDLGNYTSLITAVNLLQPITDKIWCNPYSAPPQLFPLGCFTVMWL